MRAAFKEWSVIVEALGSGAQIIILRKGGIAEGRGGFAVKHRSFLLFPTRFHQQREGVIEAARRRYDETLPAMPPEGLVRIEYCAEAVASHTVESRTALRRLRPCHVWSDEVVDERFGRGDSQGLSVIVVRVSRLSAPRELPMISSYGGCRSWLEVADDLDTSGAAPVLSDGDFGSRWMEIESAVGAHLA